MRLCWLLIAALAGAAPASSFAAGDPPRYRLDELREIARARHPSLESASAAVAEALAAIRQARTVADPEARFELRRAEAGAVSDPEYLVELEQPLPLPGVRRARVEVGQSGLRRAEHERLEAGAAVDAAVGRLYVEILLAQATVEVTRESETLSRRLAELLQRRVEVGEAPPLDALKAEAELYARRRASVEARRGLEAARLALDAFCGNALGPSFEIAGALAGPARLPDVRELAERIERDNPRIRSARAAVEAAEARERLERSLRMPGLALSASHESELDKSVDGVGVGLTLPLWNRNRAGVAASAAAVGGARAELRAVSLELRSALLRTVAEHAAAAETVALHDEGWRRATQESVAIAEFSFASGEISLLDLLDAQRAQLAVSLEEAEARARLALSRFEIERLLGGKPIEERTDENP